jgi:hypothetical protein
MASLLAFVVPTLPAGSWLTPWGGASRAWAQYLPDPGFGDPYAPTGVANQPPPGAGLPSGLPPNMANNFGPGAPHAPLEATRPASWPGGSADPARSPQPAAAPAPAATARGPADYRMARSLPGSAPPPEPRKSVPQPPYDPAEIIGHVGTEVIQASEVLLNVRMYIRAMAKEHASELARLTPEQRTEQLKPLEKELVQRSLDEMVKVKLLVTELKQKIPAESLAKFENNVRSHFNSHEIKRLMEEHQANSIPDLENKLRSLGTSLEAQRTVFVDRNLAGSWLNEHTKDDPAPPTHEQLLSYYKDHATEWDTPARVRWEQLTAKFENFNSKAEAYRAIAQWGRDVWRGVPLAQVAKARSQDFAADEGGVHEWASRGSLKSTVLDDALFSLPVGRLSVIIEDDDGFHIVRVLAREESKHAAFTEVQMDIKNALKSTGKERRQAEYIAKLRERIPVWTILDDDFADRTAPTAAQRSATAAPTAAPAPLQR